MKFNLEEKGVTKTIFLALFPVHLGYFWFKKMELDLLYESNRLICLDLTPLRHNESFKNVFLRRTPVSSIKSIDSWTALVSTIATIRSSHAKSSIVILNHITPGTLKRIVVLILVRLYLRKRWSHFIGFANGGMPLLWNSGSFAGKGSRWWNRLGLGLLKNPITFSFKVLTFLSEKYGHLLVNLNTHILVAGSDWKNLTKNTYPRNPPKIIEGHSDDYNSMFFRNSDMNFQAELGDIAVFFEPPISLFVGNNSLFSLNLKLTPSKWFSSLATFFEYIEKSMGVRVVIAAHYKTNHPSPHMRTCFSL